jgi:outer membrane protein with beta-barrel domain
MRMVSLLAFLLLALTAPALAQTRIFASGDAFADHKRFSGDSTESKLDVTGAGGGGGVGAQVSDRWDVRGEVQVGSTTTITQALLPPVTTFQSRSRNRITAYSALIGFSPAVATRVRFTVVGGVSFLHIKTEVDSIPAGLVIVQRTSIANVASPTVGVEVPIMIGSNFAVVPALRVHSFEPRPDGTNGFAIRPGVAVRWIQ